MYGVWKKATDRQESLKVLAFVISSSEESSMRSRTLGRAVQ